MPPDTIYTGKSRILKVVANAECRRCKARIQVARIEALRLPREWVAGVGRGSGESADRGIPSSLGKGSGKGPIGRKFLKF